jgi:hypothetical protein
MIDRMTRAIETVSKLSRLKEKKIRLIVTQYPRER